MLFFMDAFTNLQQEYKSCRRCPTLCQSRTQVVFGSGNPHAKVLLIGEAPGANEDRNGVPFVGMAGKVLNELLASAGIMREDVFITNTILCRPENNRPPEKEEVENCRERLDTLIQIMQPKVIVTIGNFATERVLGKKGITSLRGKVHQRDIARQDVTIVPVVHPASYLYSGRNPEMLEQMKQDFKLISSVIGENRKQKNLNDYH